jgi:L-threonylcarbamoyladenylate synthase
MIISVAEAVAKLQTGGIVAIPTETVYGLAGRIDDESALKQIFMIKQRPFFDPLIVHVSDLATAKRLSRDWPPVFDLLAQEFWPGPLTLITRKAELVSSLITSGLETVALRWPNHPVALQILQELQIPLAAPSANLFGRTSPTTAEHVEHEFSGKIPVVDGGQSEVGVESTVLAYDDTTPDKLHILRPGGISRTQLQKVLHDHGLNLEIVRTSSSASPGHLKAHYQPSCPVVILEDKAWSEEFRKAIEGALDRPFPYIHEMKLGPTAQVAARRLYGEFRQFSEVQGGLIVITRTKEHTAPEWEAVWDRIERAASFTF